MNKNYKVVLGLVVVLILIIVVAVVVSRGSARPGEDAVGQVMVSTQTTPTKNTEFTPASSSYIFTKDLSQGMTDHDVLELQNQLSAEGLLSGNYTDYFGPLTLAAVKKFQVRYDINPADGIVGQATRNVLNISQDQRKPQPLL